MKSYDSTPSASERFTRRVRTCIVGCGRVADFHARHLRWCTAADLVAVVDTNQLAADRLARKYQVPGVFPSFAHALADATFDAVHITTPPDSHDILTSAALRHGKHVLVEKPVAFSSETVVELQELARQNRVLLTPDFSLYFHSGFRRLRQWLAEGKLGRLIGIECYYHAQIDKARLGGLGERPWLFSLPAGPLHNFMTHPLYLVIDLLGSVDAVDVYAQHVGYLPDQLVDHLELIMHGHGCRAFVSVSLAARPAQIVLVAHGTTGEARVDLSTFQIAFYPPRGSLKSAWRIVEPAIRGGMSIFQTALNCVAMAGGQLAPYHGLRELIRRFYRAIVDGQPSPVSDRLVLAVADAESKIIADLTTLDRARLTGAIP